MLPFSPKMHEKPSIIYKAKIKKKTHLLLSKLNRKRDQTWVYAECFGHSSDIVAFKLKTLSVEPIGKNWFKWGLSTSITKEFYYLSDVTDWD